MTDPPDSYNGTDRTGMIKSFVYLVAPVFSIIIDTAQE